jgi:hypothetical protein
MNTLRSRLLALVVGLSLASFGLLSRATPRADARPEERHPHIHHAIRELREAKKELEKADHDFGGHRVEAIKAIDHAVKQLEEALKFDKK